MFAPIGNVTNVFENDITLFGIWHDKVFDLTHINGPSIYPGVRVNLPRIWDRLPQVERCHIIHNTIATTILVIFLKRLFVSDIIENVFAKSDFWNKIRQPAPVSPIRVVCV